MRTHAPPARPDLLAGEKLPPAPLQQRSLDKRARLEAAGLALFGEKGYEGTSIEEIARRAGLATGGFYGHFRSKRQLLLALTDELLESLGRLDLRPSAGGDVRVGLREMLARALSSDLRYLGAYRAWQEAALADPDLARKQEAIHAWTTARVATALQHMQQLPGARAGLDIPALAHAFDRFFWSLLADAVRSPDVEVEQWVDAATHLVYHALFTDLPQRVRRGRTA
ncbi:MAG: helix-turn-helix domain-containing protein [Gemmatimonadaceae bacterium]